jgi:sensor domain CHASE-containing protein
MTVRRKTLLIIAITCLGLVIVLYAASRSFLLGGFIKLEQTSARENVQRVLNAFDQNFNGTARFTADHAASDNLYNSIDHPGEFIHSLMGEDARGTPTTQRFSFVILTNVSARVVVARGRDILTGAVQDIPKSLAEHISLADPLLARSVMSGGLQGLLLLPEGPLLITSYPILMTSTEGPAHGYMLAARYLESGGDLKALEKTTHFSLVVHRLDGSELPPDFREALPHLTAAGAIHVRPMNDSVIGGYTLLNDIYDRPALILRVEMPRVIYQQGRLSQLYFVGALLIAGIVFGGVVQLLLERSVVSRLSSLNGSVRSIADSSVATFHKTATARRRTLPHIHEQHSGHRCNQG